MKPLNKLEQEMFKTLTGFDFNENLIHWETQIENARAAAQVAIDIASRAASYGYHVHLDETRGIRSNGYFTRFLESEGITE